MLKGTSLVIQWLRFCTSNAGCTGSIPGLGTKIPYAMRCRQKKKKKKKNAIFLSHEFIRKKIVEKC